MALAQDHTIPEYFVTTLDDREYYDEVDGVDVKSLVLLTPDNTPTKDFQHVRGTDSNSPSDNSDLKPRSKASLSRSHSDSYLDSPKPTQRKLTRSELHSKCVLGQDDQMSKPEGRTKGRSGRPKRETTKSKAAKSLTSAVNDATKAEIESKSSIQKTKKKSSRSRSVPGVRNPPDGSNKLVTDFFPVRRSNRMSSTDVKKQQQKNLEDKILSGCEDGLNVVQIPNKGRGVVSTKVFRRGDFVVEYIGDLVDGAISKAREEAYSADPELGCYMYYFNFKEKRYCVDATAESDKLGRLLNHSKLNGNCATKVVGIGEQPYLILVATRAIKIGEELSYDYGDRNKEALEAHPWLAL